MSDQMFLQAISALAQIDEELGMPDDACNNTQATLAAIRLLKSAHGDDLAEVDRLGKLLAEAVRLVNYCKQAGYMTNPAISEQATDFLRRATLSGGNTL